MTLTAGLPPLADDDMIMMTQQSGMDTIRFKKSVCGWSEKATITTIHNSKRVPAGKGMNNCWAGHDAGG